MAQGRGSGAAGHIGTSSRSPAPLIHSDTSFLIRSLRVGSPESERLEAWMQTADNETFAMSAIAAIADRAPIATSNPRDFSRFEEYGLAVA